ncbi:MAG: SGNH/GDSL hydrolase family protein, partial [Clostridia bacterium]|nr:SGNH/GDSL hydrolase family protein [Clostridia bacterium]
EDAVKASGVNTVYLSIMALNELGIYSTDCVKRTYDSTVKLIKAIQEKSPAVRVVILSNTYMVYNKNNYKNLNNGNISALNNMVLDYCNANGLDFIDVSTMLMDGNVLADKYCKDIDDGGCHINDTGFAIWTCVLRNYAYLKQKGLYKNPVKMPTYTKNK